MPLRWSRLNASPYCERNNAMSSGSTASSGLTSHRYFSIQWSGTHQDRSLAWPETVLGPTVYLYDGRNLLEEVDSFGNVLARYTEGGMDEPFAELRSGTTSYYEQDGISAVSSLSNSAGALANTYAYDSFGKLTASTGSLVNPFQSRDANSILRPESTNTGRVILTRTPAGSSARIRFSSLATARTSMPTRSTIL
jgi:hypothetical protein